jgi:hypothetical protein
MPVPTMPESEYKPEVKAELTRRRKKFAKLVAAGYTQEAAYEGAYNIKGGSKNGHRQNGHKVSKLPEVQELIRVLEEESLPLGDIRREQEEVLMHIKALAFHALDEKTRVTASVHLYHLLEAHRETEERLRSRRPVTHSVPVDAVVSELLQIAESQPAIELETLESETEAGDIEPEPEPADPVE